MAHLDRRLRSKRPLLVAVASRGENAEFEDEPESAGGDERAWKRGPTYGDDPADKDEQRPDDGACRGSLKPPEQRADDCTGYPQFVAGQRRRRDRRTVGSRISYEKRIMSVSAVKVVGPTDGKAGFLGSIGVRFMVDGHEADERFSLVEHPMSARALAAPLHRHTNEDEYSFVIEGRMGALLGGEHVEAGPGDLVHKPRGEWHTFWNAGDEPCRILEIISPAGFERFFAELVDLGGVAQAGPEQLGALCERFALEMDPESVPGLVQRFNLRFPGEPLVRP